MNISTTLFPICWSSLSMPTIHQGDHDLPPTKTDNSSEDAREKVDKKAHGKHGKMKKKIKDKDDWTTSRKVWEEMHRLRKRTCGSLRSPRPVGKTY